MLHANRAKAFVFRGFGGSRKRSVRLVHENRKSAKSPECERLSPIYLGYDPNSF